MVCGEATHISCHQRVADMILLSTLYCNYNTKTIEGGNRYITLNTCCIIFLTWYIYLKYLLYHIWYIHFPYICCKSIKYWVICKFPQYSQMLYWNVSNNNNVIPKVILFLIAKDLPAKWVTAWRQPFCSPLLPTMHLHTHTPTSPFIIQHTHTHQRGEDMVSDCMQPLF